MSNIAYKIIPNFMKFHYVGQNGNMVMNIIRASEIQVFDNLYSKPPNAGDGPNGTSSMSVLFSTSGTIFQGSYHYDTLDWHIHVGSIGYIGARTSEEAKNYELPPIPDRNVEYWFHCPGVEDVLEDARRIERFNGHPMKCRNVPFDQSKEEIN